MTKPAEHFDLVVVGAGLVGASLALALGQSATCEHLSIALIDAGKPPPPTLPNDRFDPRVVAITRRSQQLFQRLGIWDDIEFAKDGHHRACPYTHMHVWDGEGTGQIDFDCHELHQDNLGYIVENSLLIQRLIGKIETMNNIKLYWGDGVSAIELDTVNCLRLTSGQRLMTPLVCAADGANSQIRTLCQFQSREWHYGQRAIVTTVKTELAHQHTAWQRFMGSGPLAFLPLIAPDSAEMESNDHYSSIVWSVDEDLAAQVEDLNDDNFKEALQRAFEGKLGRVEWVDRRFSFPLRQRHALTYVRPGVALLGDAAHTIHPLAGQGVNLGLLDVQALVTEVERAIQRGISLRDYSILRRYQRARIGNNLAMMGLMEGFKQLFGSSNAWLQLMRNTGMAAVDRQTLLRNGLASRAMGL